MKTSRIPPTQKSPGRSTERRLSSNLAAIDDMATPCWTAFDEQALGRRAKIASERMREKSRSCAAQGGRADRQCACRMNGVRQLEAKRGSQSRSASRNVDVERDRSLRSEDRTAPRRWSGSLRRNGIARLRRRSKARGLLF